MDLANLYMLVEVLDKCLEALDVPYETVQASPGVKYKSQVAEVDRIEPVQHHLLVFEHR